MFHSRGANNKINVTNRNELSIKTNVYKDNISSLEEFLKRDKLFTIHQRHIQSLATELFKDKGNLSSNIMYDIFQTGKINYSLRLQTNFASNCVNTNKFGLNLPGYFASKVWKKFSLENKNP